MTNTEIRNTILEILQIIGIPIVLDLADYEEDVNLLDLEIDSLAFFSLIVEIESSFSIELPDEVIVPEKLISLNAFVSTIADLIDDD